MGHFSVEIMRLPGQLSVEINSPPESRRIPLRRLAQHGHEPTNVGPVAADRLFGGAAMLPEPSEVSRHVRVSIRHRFDRWDSTLPSQKLDKVPNAPPSTLRT